MRAWMDICPSTQAGNISALTFKVLRDYIYAVLKGGENFRVTKIDPPLPMPELVRDEFNAYKKTLLQEHLYEQIFKEASNQSASSSASTSPSLTDMPSLGSAPESSSHLAAQLQELESSVFELIAEVNSDLWITSVVQERTGETGIV